ncbi:MAG: hypothetical protein AABX52_02230 [Nanoarchaeota archaeon]
MNQYKLNKSYKLYTGPGKYEIWETDFLPAEDIYTDNVPALYCEDDMITDQEEAFMTGYLSA